MNLLALRFKRIHNFPFGIICTLEMDALHPEQKFLRNLRHKTGTTSIISIISVCEKVVLSFNLFLLAHLKGFMAMAFGKIFKSRIEQITIMRFTVDQALQKCPERFSIHRLSEPWWTSTTTLTKL